jgi:hypothetical protein
MESWRQATASERLALSAAGVALLVLPAVGVVVWHDATSGKANVAHAQTYPPPCQGDLSDPLVADGCIPDPDIACMADHVLAEQEQARTGRKVEAADIGDACSIAARSRATAR